jgi:hypothetical protein
MAIRIDIETKEPADVIHVSGRLVISSIEQLTAVCEPMETNFVLELSELMFADNAAVEVIRSLQERGAEIRGASSFIKLLINGEQS